MKHSKAMWCEVASTADAMGPRYPMLYAEFWGGQSYMIPEAWVIGFCRSGATVADAIRHWHEQAMMAAECAA